MEITRISPFTGKLHTMEINVTQAQLALWEGGMLIQDAMSHLSADEREFIMTGITASEWDAEFSEEHQPARGRNPASRV